MLLFAFLLPLSGKVYAQCDLFCDDFVHVTLGQNGFAVITPDMILEDTTQCTPPFRVDVLVAGRSIGDTVDCSLVNRVLMVEVTHIATGNRCMSSIRVEDKGGPVIVCRDTIVPCGTPVHPDSLGYPQFSDNCDPDPMIFYSDSVVNLQCSGGLFEAIIFRSWRGRDAMNNLSLPCVQRIFLESADLSQVVFPPNRDGIAAPMIDCSTPSIDPVITGSPTIDGVPVQGYCKFTVTYEDSRLDLCEGSYKILRKWIVVDCCSNVDTSAYQIIKVMDTTPPSIICPDTLRLFTNENSCASTFLLPSAQVTDDCSSIVHVMISYPGGSVGVNGGVPVQLPAGIHEIHYKATDQCGNDTTCTTIAIITDDDEPIPVCVEYLVVNINSSGIACIPAESFDAGSTDNCCLDSIAVKRMGEPDSLFRDRVCLDCNDVGNPVMVVVRFWDCSGNFNECMTEVKAQDKLAPRITCPPDVTALCTDDLTDTLVTGFPVIRENCDSILVTYTDDTSQLTMCRTGLIIRTWKVTDGVGFMATCSQQIQLVDTTDAIITFPPDVTLSCPIDLDTVDTGMPVILSDCENYGVAIRDTTFSGDCFFIIRRTFRVLEWCSQEDTLYTQTINVLDQDPPDWDQAPGSLDTFFLCATAYDPPSPTAEDDCTAAIDIRLIYDRLLAGSCPNDYQRLQAYVAEDGCGNVSDTFFVRVIVRDTVPPVLTGVPLDTSLNCGNALPEPNVDATDNCPGIVQLSFREISLPADCPALERNLQEWLAVDVCGNMTIEGRIVTYIDTIPPVANPLPGSTVECPEDIPPANITLVTGISDNCNGPVTIDTFPLIINNRCNDTIVRIYRLQDSCGNAFNLEQQFIILDTVPPRLTCPADRMVDVITMNGVCETFVGDLLATAIDNCPGTVVTITNNSPYADNPDDDASGTYPLGIHQITFTGIDECGNTETCTMTLTVEDIVPPTIFCHTSIITLYLDSMGMVIVDPTLIIDTSRTRDFCSPVLLSTQPMKFDCDSLGGRQVVGIATDTFGNMAICPVLFNNVIVADTLMICNTQVPIAPGLVMGRVSTPSGKPLSGVEMSLIDGPNGRNLMIGSGGMYYFDSIPQGSNCMIRPFKNDQPLNGVTTFDLVLLSRHILGDRKLTSPYKIIAADVNRSGNISIADIIELRKMILGRQTGFSNNQSWRFIDAHYQFQNPFRPLSEPFPEVIQLQNFSQSMLDQDFIAIKTGDLNGNASIDDIYDTSERSLLPALPLFVENQTFSKGDLVKIPLISPAGIHLSGFQFTLNFDPSQLEFLEVEPGSASDISLEHIGTLWEESGTLVVSWNGLPATSDREWFTFVFKAKSGGRIASAWSIDSGHLAAEAYTTDLEIKRIDLRYTNGRSDTTTEMDFELFQNEPNPFSGATTISFYIKTEAHAILEIVDLSGRTVFRQAGWRAPGLHKVQVPAEAFPGSGIYSYRLSAATSSQTKRLIVLK